MQPVDVSSPADVEGKLKILRVYWNGELRVQNFDGGFDMKSYLNQSSIRCNRSP
jgi:hypothetical protein